MAEPSPPLLAAERRSGHDSGDKRPVDSQTTICNHVTLILKAQKSSKKTVKKADTTDTDRHVHEVKLDDALGPMARRLTSLASAIFAKASGQTELTAMQMGILLVVHQNGLISLRKLSLEMHIDRSTLQEIVKRMVGRGLLHRRTPNSDRRTHELWLTADGIEQVRKNLGALDKVQLGLLEGIPEKDAKVTLRCIQAILARHNY